MGYAVGLRYAPHVRSEYWRADRGISADGLCRAQGRLPIQTLQEARDSITSIAIPPASAGCAEIITGCVDGVVRSYDIRMGKLVGDTVGGPSFTYPIYVNIAN